jgi:hypothetical protein
LANARRTLGISHLPLADLSVQEFDRGIGRLKGAIIRTLGGVGKLGINDATLCGLVLLVSGWEFVDDVDDSAGHFKLKLIASLDAGASPNAGRHYQLGSVVFKGDGDRTCLLLCSGSVPSPRPSVSGVPACFGQTERASTTMRRNFETPGGEVDDGYNLFAVNQATAAAAYREFATAGRGSREPDSSTKT